MKKILAAVILLVYFTVSTGFAVSVHYCMEQFDSAQLGTSHDDICDKCGMDTGDNKCCRDEVKVLKLETSHLAAKMMQLNFAVPLLPVSHPDLLLSPTRNHSTKSRSIAHGPPLITQDIHIENCVFRI